MSRYRSRRRSGSSVKFSNFMQIVLTLVTILLVFSVVPLLAVISGGNNANNEAIEPENALPSFQIYGYTEADGNGFYTCYFEEGMTWAEFCESEYDYCLVLNTGDTVQASYQMADGGFNSYPISGISPDDLIVANETYGEKPADAV